MKDHITGYYLYKLLCGVIIMEGRKKDIQKLCEAVLEISSDWYDNPNGAYETSCPFCSAIEYRGGGGRPFASMQELKHDQDCAYLIAKDLSTGVNAT